MKKLIAILVALFVLPFAFAAQVSQTAELSSTGAPPTISHAWVLPDEDSTTAGTQLNPDLGNERNDIYACVVVSDPQGRDDVQNVYVDVYHPANTGAILPCVVADGTLCDDSGLGQPWEKTGDLFKYQVHAVKLDVTSDRAVIEACKANALAAGLISQDDFDEINYQIFSQPNWYMYKVNLPMLYHQPAGTYKALAWATDTSSATSADKEIYFDWVSTLSLGLDFQSLSYGTLQPSVYKVIQGDYLMNGPAGAPTVKNNGNERIALSVESTTLLGNLHKKEINDFDVKWDPEENGFGYGYQEFDADVLVSLADPLELCQTEKIDFSAHADVGLPTDTYVGTMTISATEVVACVYSEVPTGDSYDGLYGSTVTPVTVTYEDCSTVEDVLKVEKAQNYQQGQPEGSSAGWAGWSCVESGYPQVIGGGVIPADADVLESLAWEPGATISIYNYPTTPWGYVYGAGETGWIVEGAGTTPPTSIYALCAGTA